MAPDAYDGLRILPANSAMNFLSKEDVRRFYFRTQTSSTFLGLKSPEDAQGENMFDVYNVGQRDSKYMKFRYRVAPNFNRKSCEYTREFRPLSLDDHAVTEEIGAFVKRKQGFGRAKVQAKFDASTKYSEDFKPVSKQEALGARPKSAKPTISAVDGRPPHPLRGTDQLEEKISSDHQTFIAHPLRLARAEKARPPKSNIGLLERVVPMRTAYGDEFNSGKELPHAKRRQRCQSAPTYLGGRRPPEKLPWSWGDPQPPEESALEIGTQVSAVAPQRLKRPQSAGAIHTRQPNPAASTLQVASSIQAVQKPPSQVGTRARPSTAPSRRA
mmetsp:Transcript_24384/g.39031  ORF Transcript_24384/g.39031 Transcript_24384/m.39031 type:complete len:328 (+) Transcript_24384:69-1052(+)